MFALGQQPQRAALEGEGAKGHGGIVAILLIAAGAYWVSASSLFDLKKK
jgi:hypothetical protein